LTVKGQEHCKNHTAKTKQDGLWVKYDFILMPEINNNNNNKKKRKKKKAVL